MDGFHRRHLGGPHFRMGVGAGIPGSVTPGYHRSRGAGCPTISAAGSSNPESAGRGSPETLERGRRETSHGRKATDGWPGRRSLLTESLWARTIVGGAKFAAELLLDQTSFERVAA